MGTSRTPPLWCIDRQWLLFSSAAEDSALCYTSQVFGSLGRAGPATQPPQPIPLLTMTSGVAIWSETKKINAISVFKLKNNPR